MRGMQFVLFSLVAYGLIARQPKAIVNGGILSDRDIDNRTPGTGGLRIINTSVRQYMALVITFIPAVLRRNYDFPLDPWLGLWITTAVFLHTLGSAGLYGRIPRWDNLTHAMSATLIAGAGYTVARAIDLHTDDIHIPRRFLFVYIFVVVLSFGVIWELFEFGLDVVADATGLTMPLAQKGLDDTVRDLMFNSLGALLIAVFGQVHLTGVAEALRDRLAERSA